MRNFYSIILILILILTFSSVGYCQLNITELGRLDIPTVHDTRLNDIWGYTDEAGNEYALVGAMNGVSIVDITDPTSPVEVFWVDGLNSIWRDLKTFGDYLYVTTEASQGLMIIDLSPLPSDTDLPITIYLGPEDAEWHSAHNLFEKDGYMYIFGAGRDNGGVIILDITTDPMNPIEVGIFDDWYVHDGYVKNDTGYFGHIYEGFFSIVDLTDKSSPVLLGSAYSPTSFTHNIWSSEDGDFAFTTDEVSGGYIGSFDVSDPTSIIAVDKIQSSPGTGKVPHNAHVKGNYLYTSYYTDGLVIHDITHPHNLVEVANYDTSPLDSPTTDGCWGTYPFFASGNVIASDRGEGLFIFSVAEHQGSYLEGNITEAVSGIALNSVTIEIEGTTISDNSNVLGNYAIGTEAEGTINVTYSKVLYYPQTIAIPFENGIVFEQDIILEKIPEFSVNVKVLEAGTLIPIEGANVIFEHTLINHEGITNASGEVSLPMYYEDNYQFSAGNWGNITACFTDTMITSTTGEIIVLLEKGIMDDFTFDFGWSATGDASRGHWEREVPVGVFGSSGIPQNPSEDIGYDCGKSAYMTGNGTMVSNTEEVNDGQVFLFSPVFDLTGYDNPHINYATWFFCKHGADPDDTLEVYLLNGIGDFVLIDQYYNGGLPMSQWNSTSIEVNSLITTSASMQILFTLSDYVETENVTEGGLDNFSVTNFSLSTINEEIAKNESSISIYPNPFNDNISIKGIEEGWLTVLDVTGRQIAHLPIESNINLAGMERGTYFFVISDMEGNKLDVFTEIKY